MPNPACVAPQGGRLCHRALRDGSALVGVLHLPAEFVPVEGACYAMQTTPDGVLVDTTAVSASLEENMQSWGVGDLLTQRIWNKTQSAEVMPVRFIEAFPDSNVWTVYGASHHALAEDHPPHSWFDVAADGTLNPIEAPFDARGCGIGQILNTHPVWPDRQGELHTLPQTQSSWRAHYLAYHQLLAKSARDPQVDALLEQTIAQNPRFRELSIGRVDRTYCQFLAKLEDRGEMGLETPRSAEEHARREGVSSEVMGEVVGVPSPRKSARPV